MSVVMNPYLHFDGNAEEALHFYKKVFGGNETVSRYGDNPAPDLQAEHKNLIMHADLQAPDLRLMLSDSGPMGTPVVGSNVDISLSGTPEDEARLTMCFNQLSEGGKVTVSLSKAEWGDTFGMLTDKYNISWIVNITTS